ncbi:hypothetical protein QVN42_04045 [Yersinia nurmii]|uniref:Uncharacterized protein n=1 Tax=Yersinia nurmii TaxID=685706 RepID=A0AAW7K5C0_9GAMM|nr:hypothetical protein [Yersinia nurmii]MDN0086574.1 hypothetical protein [Yersinia nurmii]CNE57202.1 Uncharacterised protein [Yersinia nurmii]
MLDNYFGSGNIPSDQQKQRLLAVQAALEIIKQSVGASEGAAYSRVNDDMKHAVEWLAPLADAIQQALIVKK